MADTRQDKTMSIPSFRRSLLLALILAVAALLHPVSGRTANALGVNLDAIGYFSSELPFLNILKSAGSSSPLGRAVGWYTSTASAWDTKEEAYLQLDADGYPISLDASGKPPGGQQFTFVKTLLNFNLPRLAPGQTYVYPPGTYRLKFEGRGTVKLEGDAGHGSGDTCPAGLALSNSKADTYVSCTFTVAHPGARSGILLEITAITDSTDHPRDISVVQNAYAANYDAGALFNPALLAALRGFSSLRFMDWMNTNGEFSGYFASAAIRAGSTSLSLATAWLLPSGSYPLLFIDGERRMATFTLGATAVSWTGALAHSISPEPGGWRWASQTYYASFYVITKTWANRARPANAFWSLDDGVPLEAIIALCNELKADCHLNVPLSYSDDDIEAMGQLVMSGTHMQGGYGALSPPLAASFELSNEVWNSQFPQYGIAGSLGGLAWPTATPGGGNYQWNRNYLGMRTAQMATDLRTAVGPALFDRVIPVLGAQAAGTYSATTALQTAYWRDGPADKYPIKALAIAPYWGGNPSAADCEALTHQSDGGLTDFFATLSGQTGAGGHTYANIPSGGYLGEAEGWITSYVNLMPSYPSLKLIAYESGQNFYATSSRTCTGWPNLVTAAERDPRMGAAYANFLNFWRSAVGGSAGNINYIYSDVSALSQYGAWGLLESVMQTVDPLASAPPKYQAAMRYGQGQ